MKGTRCEIAICIAICVQALLTPTPDRLTGFLFISALVCAIGMLSLTTVDYIGYLLGDDIPLSQRIKIVPALVLSSGVIVLAGYKILSYLGGLS